MIPALLVLHIAAGFVGMYGGLVPLLSRKGGPEHRRWGWVFVWAMGGAALSALPLAWWRQDPLQAGVGVFAGYGALLGVRALGRRGRPGQQGAPLLDVASTALAGVAFLALLWWGASARGEGRLTGVAFGALGLLLAARDLHARLSRDASARRRIVDHLLASTLALLAGCSAFLNTQLLRLTGLDLPADARMLLPLALGLPPLVIVAVTWDRRLRRGLPAVTADPGDPPPLARLLWFGRAEGVSFLLLVLVAVPLKRLAGEGTLVRLLGPVHGALFVLYVTAVLLTARALGWPWRRALAGLAAAVLPFGTFVFEARLRRAEAEAEEAAKGREPSTNQLVE